MKEPLFGKTLSELKKVSEDAGLPGYAARQISEWLYKKNAATFDEMTNLSKKTGRCFPKNMCWAYRRQQKFSKA
jgi:23S rRNA (adenine2503-C2)-methyltransferase